jgi:hypothetical protein
MESEAHQRWAQLEAPFICQATGERFQHRKEVCMICAFVPTPAPAVSLSWLNRESGNSPALEMKWLCVGLKWCKTACATTYTAIGGDSERLDVWCADKKFPFSRGKATSYTF